MGTPCGGRVAPLTFEPGANILMEGRDGRIDQVLAHMSGQILFALCL